MKKAYVYRITSPSGKIYIGSTQNLQNRLSKYRHHKCVQQPKLHASLLKHGFENHRFEIVHECTADNMFEKEAYYGNLYNSLSRDYGLNLQLPKVGDKYQNVSDCVREKRRKFMLGRPLPESARQKMIGRKVSPETIQKLKDSHRGQIPTAETVAKIVAKNTGKKRDEAFLQKMRDRMRGIPMPKTALYAAYAKTSKRIINTKTGEVYKSIGEASKFTGKYKSYLSKALSGFIKNETPFTYF